MSYLGPMDVDVRIVWVEFNSFSEAIERILDALVVAIDVMDTNGTQLNQRVHFDRRVLDRKRYNCVQLAFAFLDVAFEDLDGSWTAISFTIQPAALNLKSPFNSDSFAALSGSSCDCSNSSSNFFNLFSSTRGSLTIGSRT